MTSNFAANPLHLTAKSLYMSLLLYPLSLTVMTVTDEQLDHLAKLAALRLTAEEKVKLGKQVNSIIDFVGELQKVDVEGIEPLSHPIEGMTVPLYEKGEVYADPDSLLANTKHQRKDRGIVMKSALNQVEGS